MLTPSSDEIEKRMIRSTLGGGRGGGFAALRARCHRSVCSMAGPLSVVASVAAAAAAVVVSVRVAVSVVSVERTFSD